MLKSGDPSAEDKLIALIYADLKRMAGRLLRNEAPGQTLQTTVLVHDVLLRLLRGNGLDWQNSPHFFATAARQMRRLLVDHARSTRAQKRPRRSKRVPLDAGVLISESRPDELLAIDEAVSRLASVDARQAQIVEMRIYAGLSVQEIAAALGTSDRTVKRDWAVARAWLYRELNQAAVTD
jgi:RNA polymerase sigma factor (TIGR02999 family)